MFFEYKNQFLYFVIRPELSDSVDNNFIYCSSVNITRFLPLTKGRHRIGQNPVEKGLQSVNNEVRSLFLAIGAVLKMAKGNLCSDIRKLTEEIWYTESFFINCPPETIIFRMEGVISYAVLNLFKKIFLAMMIDEKVPDVLPSPKELEDYINKILQKYQSI